MHFNAFQHLLNKVKQCIKERNRDREAARLFTPLNFWKALLRQHETAFNTCQIMGVQGDCSKKTLSHFALRGLLTGKCAITFSILFWRHENQLIVLTSNSILAMCALDQLAL